MTTSVVSRFPNVAACWPPQPGGSLAWVAGAGLPAPPRFPTTRDDRLAAENALRIYAAVAEFAYDALIGTTRCGQVRSWNHAAVRLFGYTAAQAIGRQLTFLADPDQIEQQAHLMKEALAGRIGAPIETTRRRRDGATVSIELSVMPIRNAAGAIVALAGVARDISARKLADAHRALLAEELTHRVKNTLATVHSIAMHSLRGAASLDDFAITFSARLNALSATHTLLTQSGWKGAAVGELVETELAPYLGDGPANLLASGPRVDLDPGQSLALGMVLHELATNAAKYGALSVAEGRVHVGWEILTAKAAPRLKLVWRESGGPAVVPPTHQGFGTRLMTRGLAHELDGDVALTFPVTGAICEIDAPLRPASTA